ncbi:MAG: peptidoglycan glycosyltransferase [Clostridiales bacterium]|jgi:peptidoglycan glycosyltransferase|nr:peptidoglycan glycosyltransferase [Clostridiales bacterium]
MINKRIVRTLFLLTLMFLSLIGYLTHFEIFRKEAVERHAFNKRQWAWEEDIARGTVTDRSGVALAVSEGAARVYRFGSLYSHVIGYNSKIYGKTLLENKYNKLLLGQDDFTAVLNLAGDGKVGFDLTLTIDHGLQKLASDQLGGRNGAVVALNPKTGEVLALVSKPDFDPSDAALSKRWAELTESKQSPLLPRATGGLYAPGSTFKIITAAAAIENGLDGGVYEDSGAVTIDGASFDNFGKKANGSIDFRQAFSLSSNYVFCTLGARLGGAALRETAGRFGFDRTLDFDISVTKSRFQQSDGGEADGAALGIGQGETLATPLQMAMVAGAVANGGVMMKPYLVRRVTNKNGGTVRETRPQQLYRAVSPEVADQLTEMMIDAVRSGSGKAAAVSGVVVAGKTGTAENELLTKEKNREHTWFVGFSPARDPQIAVAVMLEYSGGSGGELCAPIAGEILRYYKK